MKITAGMLLMAAALATSSSCARSDWIDRTLVTVDVTGVWSGVISNSLSSVEVSIDLRQEEPRVEGSVKVKGMIHHWMQDIPGPIEGTVSGDRFEFKRTSGPLRGDVTVSGDEMRGQANGTFGSGQIFLRRVDSSPGPSSPKP